MEQRQIIPVDRVLPPKLTLLPLPDSPMFPGVFAPMMIREGPLLGVVQRALRGDGFVGLVAARNAHDSAHDPPTEPHNVRADDLYGVGTAAKIVRKINLPDGGVNIFVSTLKRSASPSS